MRSICVVLMATILVGCVTVPTYLRTTEFNESEYLPYLETGTAEISGQAFLKTRGGDVKYAAGNEIFLVPQTSYSRDWYIMHVVGGSPITPADPRESDYIRSVVANGEGRFVFKNLPAGKYYIYAPIYWEIFEGNYSRRSGGNAHAAAEVADGQSVDLVATR